MKLLATSRSTDDPKRTIRLSFDEDVDDTTLLAIGYMIADQLPRLTDRRDDGSRRDPD